MRVQKNELLQLIESKGLQPTEFELRTYLGATFIVHEQSGSSFTIDSEDGLRFAGGTRVGEAGAYSYKATTWDALTKHFSEWVKDVKREVDAPDMWEELRRGKEFLREVSKENFPNTPFTPAEQIQIEARLDEITEYVKKTYSLSVEQLERIDRGFEEVKQASRRVGRKDWFLLFAGTLLTLVMSAILPPDAVQHAFMMMGHIFLAPPPEIPPQT